MFCFETIKIHQGIICNLEFHNARLNHTRQKLFGATHAINLSHHITHLPIQPTKCRVLYDASIHSITYTPYHQRQTPSSPFVLQLVHDDNIQYNFKYNNRQKLIRLLDHAPKCDEILIIKNTLATDTSTSNIAILIEEEWLTPKQVLLEGTMRRLALRNGQIRPASINAPLLKKAQKIALLNALVGFFVIEDFVIKE